MSAFTVKITVVFPNIASATFTFKFNFFASAKNLIVI